MARNVAAAVIVAGSLCCILGWRADADITMPDGGRLLQFTPPGSACSILIGPALTSSAPGSTQFVHPVGPTLSSHTLTSTADVSSRARSSTTRVEAKSGLIR
jgi:hypothetical protein